MKRLVVEVSMSGITQVWRVGNLPKAFEVIRKLGVGREAGPVSTKHGVFDAKVEEWKFLWSVCRIIRVVEGKVEVKIWGREGSCLGSEAEDGGENPNHQSFVYSDVSRDTSTD